MKHSFFLLLLGACVSATGGERVDFHVVVDNTAPVSEIDGAPAIQWTDDAGWTITLTEATAWIGPMYLWSQEPRLDTSGLGAWWRGLMPVAYASDQFRAGFLTGEMTFQTEVDLLGESVDLPDGAGLAGPSRSAELWLEPVLTDNDKDTLSWRGTAEKDGVVLPFRGGLTVDDDQVQPGDIPALLRRMRGLLWEAELTQGGTVHLGVDARRWFDGVDFSTLADAPTDAAGDHVVDPQHPLSLLIYARARRVGSTGPWHLTWSPPSE